MSMSKNERSKQDELILKTMDQCVPQDHIVRKMEEHLDLTFIYAEVEYLYSNIGHRSLDPVVFFKIIMLKYMFGIKSIRETMRQIEVNLAYRWYLGFSFDDKIPHHSTISKVYFRKFKDSDIFEKIFMKILETANQSGYISNTDVFADATHIKANANKNKFTEENIIAVTSIKESLLEDINELRLELGKKAIELDDYVLLDDEESESIDDGDDKNGPGTTTSYYDGPRKILKKENRRVKINKHDEQAGYYYRDEKEKGFVYQDHRIVDGKHNLILGSVIEPGNLHDSRVLVKLLEQLKKHQIDYERIALDSGYNSLEIMDYLKNESKESVIGYRRFGKRIKDGSKYMSEKDIFICRQGCVFGLKNIDKQGYKIYHNKTNCNGCQDKCFTSGNTKQFRRHIWQELRDENRELRISKEGKQLYKERSKTIERSFADAKMNHGLRWTLYCGQKKNQNYNWLLCGVQNLKKICILESKESKKQAESAIKGLLYYINIKIIIKAIFKRELMLN